MGKGRAVVIPQPRLIHPVAIGILQLSRAKTLVDDDYREPRGDADRSKPFNVKGQVKWFDAERFQATQLGPEAHNDGYVLFRMSDLRKANVPRIKQGDRFVTLGAGKNQVQIDVYVTNLRYMGHYPDQRGPTLVRAYFKDRQPSKQDDIPIVDLGLPSVWISSETGSLFGILASQLAQSGSLAADLAFELDGSPLGFDFDGESLWTLGGSPGWLRKYPSSSLQRSGAPVAELLIRTAFLRPSRFFFDQAFYSGAWALNGDTGALGLFGFGQLAASSETPVVPGTYVTLSIGAALGSSEPVDFATDDLGWGYVAHRRTGASGGRKVWALNPAQLAASGVAVVPIAQNAGSNFDANPSGITVANDGAVWVSLFDSSSIASFTAPSLRAGGNPMPSKLITSTSLVGPVGIAFDVNNNLWVSSRGNGKLLRFSAASLATGGAKTPDLEFALGAPTDPYYLRLV